MKAVGLHCIGCGKGKLMTVDSRPVHGGIRRRKKCNQCGYRITTIEKLDPSGKAPMGRTLRMVK